jgi:predicted phosphohydrolase
MRLFAIGDLHLSGNPPTKPMEIFGPAWQDHWRRICTDWQSRVSDDDTVLLAGDISWAMHLKDAMCDLDEVRALPGRKIIIRGNHDYWWESVSKLTRLSGEGNMTYIQDDCLPIDDGRIAICGTRGWICPGDIHFKEETDAKPYRRELLRAERVLQKAEELGCEHKLLLLHYPPVCDLTKPSGFTDLLEKYKVPLCVFGHLHGMRPETMFPRMYNGTLLQLVSADYRDCKLLEIKFDDEGVVQ